MLTDVTVPAVKAVDSLHPERDTWQGGCREFDCAAFVVYVGEVASHAFRSSQWLFLAQGGVEGPPLLMALESTGGTDGFVPIPPSLMGALVRPPLGTTEPQSL